MDPEEDDIGLSIDRTYIDSVFADPNPKFERGPFMLVDINKMLDEHEAEDAE